MKQTTKIILRFFIEHASSTTQPKNPHKYNSYGVPSAPMGFKSRANSDYFLTSAK